MTDPNPNRNPPTCPTCGDPLVTSVDYAFGHKTSDGWQCENPECPETWFDFGEVEA